MHLTQPIRAVVAGVERPAPGKAVTMWAIHPMRAASVDPAEILEDCKDKEPGLVAFHLPLAATAPGAAAETLRTVPPMAAMEEAAAPVWVDVPPLGGGRVRRRRWWSGRQPVREWRHVRRQRW